MSGNISKIAAFFGANWKKVLLFFAAQGAWRTASWIFDNSIYPLVVNWLGTIVGGVIMTLASTCICMGMLVYYRNKKVSWLGWDYAIEFLNQKEQELQEALGMLVSPRALIFFVLTIVICMSNKYIGILALFGCMVAFKVLILLMRCLKVKFWGDAIAFVFLSIFEDPFLTTAYLRHGKADGLVKKDWTVLIASIFLSNAYWILRTVAFIEILKYYLSFFFLDYQGNL